MNLALFSLASGILYIMCDYKLEIKLKAKSCFNELSTDTRQMSKRIILVPANNEFLLSILNILDSAILNSSWPNKYLGIVHPKKLQDFGKGLILDTYIIERRKIQIYTFLFILR